MLMSDSSNNGQDSPTTLPKPTPPTTKARINDQGLIELVDLYTGRVIAIQRKPDDDLLRNHFDNLIRIETPEGPVWIEKSIDPAKVLKRKHPKYSKFWADLVAGEILNGKTIGEALATHHLDFATHTYWKNTQTEYRTIIDEAKRARAELFADEALVNARSPSPNKTRINHLQWQAEKADPDQYGQKQKMEHSGSVAHTIVVETGIRRNIPPPQGFESVIEKVEENSRSVIPLLEQAKKEGEDVISGDEVRGSELVSDD